MLAMVQDAPTAIYAPADLRLQAATPLFDVLMLESGELVSDRLTKDEARAKARMMNTGAATDELVIWRPHRNRLLDPPQVISVSPGYLVKELEPPETTEPSDSDLMDDAQAGSHEAFEILYHRHQAAVRRVIRRHVRDAHIAEDICQNTFLKMLEYRKKPENFRAWLLTVARVECLCEFTHRKNRQTNENNHSATVIAANRRFSDRDQQLRTLIALEQIDWLRVALAQLDDDDSQILKMRFRDDMVPREIGSRLGYTAPTAYGFVRRAVDRLLGFFVSGCRISCDVRTDDPSHWWNQSVGPKESKAVVPPRLGSTQRVILIMAHHCQVAGGICDSAALLHEAFGFPHSSEPDSFGRRIDVKQIGQYRYNNGMIRLSNAAKSLERHDLIIVERSLGEIQIRLNENGIRVVGLLAAASEGKAVAACR